MTAASINQLAHLDPDLALAARCDTCVLVSAPPGVALRIAREIADHARPRQNRFDVLDCDVLNGSAMADALDEHIAAPGFLLLREVHALGPTNQRLLYQVLEARLPGSAARVIASSSVSLIDRVEQGLFDAALFYRLNTIHIQATDFT